MTWTVSQLAKLCNLSRSTLLYYESAGLLRPSRSSGNQYRRYGPKDRERLEQICFYRAAGLPIDDIRTMLDDVGHKRGMAGILERRLHEVHKEIEKLREQQRILLRLLQNQNVLRRWKVVTKDKWVSIMQAAGFTEAEMHRWHVEFEHAAPAEHQEFLEFLHIPADEIVRIREWSRAGKEQTG